MKAIIQFVKPYEYTFINGLSCSGHDLNFNPGDLISCELEYEGPGSEQFNVPVSNLTVPGTITLDHVPNDRFVILASEYDSEKSSSSLLGAFVKSVVQSNKTGTK